MAPKIAPEIARKLKIALSGDNPNASIAKLKGGFPGHASAINELYDTYRCCHGDHSADAQRCLDDVISGRTYKDIHDALDQRGLTILPPKSIAGSEDVKEFDIVNKRDHQKIFARMFTLEADGRGKMDMMTPNGNDTKAFAARARAYERKHPGTKVVLQVAGAFSCFGSDCHPPNSGQWKPDGFHLDDGKSVGMDMPNAKYGGVVVITAAGPAIYNRNKIPKDGISSGDKTTIEAVARSTPAWLKRADLFQTFTLVENGEIAVNPPKGEKPSSPDKATRRILIEREFIDKNGYPDHTWAIVQLNEAMDLYDAAIFGQDIGSLNVGLLNTGMNSLGWTIDSDGHEVFLLNPHPDELQMPNFTSVLVYVVDAKRPQKP